MKVLVIGSGGREHAIVDALARSPKAEKIYCAPGNAGIALQAECVDLKDTDVEGLANFAKEHQIDLTVVGPEAALAAGVVDRFKAEGLTIFGPTKSATRIESSKEFAKELMQKYEIPTAAFRSFTAYEEALAYVQSRPLPAVLKYDGLAAGKGVVIAETLEEADAALTASRNLMPLFPGRAAPEAILHAIRGEKAPMLTSLESLKTMAPFAYDAIKKSTDRILAGTEPLHRSSG